MRFYFEEADLWTQKKRDVFRKINQSGLPLVLFGKSTGVSSAVLRELHVPVRYVCDNNPETWGTMLWEMETVPPARLQELYSAYNVLILAAPYEAEITAQLRALAAPPSEIFCLDLYFEEEEAAGFFRSRWREAAEIYHRLADQQSKDTYEAAVRYRISRNPEALSRIALPRAEQYFPDSLGGEPFLGEREVFADAGAFTGDSIHSFMAAVRGRYNAIYAFEPAQGNYQKLLEDTRELRNVFCRQVGVGDRETTISFSENGNGSRGDEAGHEAVPVSTLDNMLGDTPVTYLKMDVEGMECAALRGAKNLIQKRHPKLAICTYHSNADMIEVPALIWKLNPDYRLYFRHYTNALVETVCYAV